MATQETDRLKILLYHGLRYMLKEEFMSALQTEVTSMMKAMADKTPALRHDPAALLQAFSFDTLGDWFEKTYLYPPKKGIMPANESIREMIVTELLDNAVQQIDYKDLFYPYVTLQHAKDVLSVYPPPSDEEKEAAWRVILRLSGKSSGELLDTELATWFGRSNRA